MPRAMLYAASRSQFPVCAVRAMIGRSSFVHEVISSQLPHDTYEKGAVMRGLRLKLSRMDRPRLAKTSGVNFLVFSSGKNNEKCARAMRASRNGKRPTTYPMPAPSAERTPNGSAPIARIRLMIARAGRDVRSIVALSAELVATEASSIQRLHPLGNGLECPASTGSLKLDHERVYQKTRRLAGPQVPSHPCPLRL